MASQAATIFKALCDEYAGDATATLMSMLEKQIELLETNERWRATVVIKTLKKSFREETGKQFPYDVRMKDLSKELHSIHDAKFGKRERAAAGGGSRRQPVVMMEIPPEMVQAVLQLGGRICRNRGGAPRSRPRMTINRHRPKGTTSPVMDDLVLSDDEE